MSMTVGKGGNLFSIGFSASALSPPVHRVTSRLAAAGLARASPRRGRMEKRPRTSGTDGREAWEMGLAMAAGSIGRSAGRRRGVAGERKRVQF